MSGRRRHPPRHHRRRRDPNAWRKPGLEAVIDRRREERKRVRAKARRRTVAWLGLMVVLLIGVGWAIAAPRLGGDSPDAAEVEAAEREVLQTTNVVFPEGLRREDIGEIVAKQTDISAEDYLAATAEGARGRALAGTRKPTSLEGYLFPATYEVNVNTTAQDLVDRQVQAFKDNTGGVDYGVRPQQEPHPPRGARHRLDGRARGPAARGEGPCGRGDLQPPQERHAAGNRRDRAICDRGVEDRADGGRPRFGLALHTRKFFGLPPGPIASPGIASILAAAEPEQHNFLYYVARADGSSGHYFATSAAEFDQLVARARPMPALTPRRGPGRVPPWRSAVIPGSPASSVGRSSTRFLR